MTSTKGNQYDVFVSFVGEEDTSHSFTDHLFAAFQIKGIVAFRGNTILPKGESIAPELLRAIEDSRIFIVVLSRNYASSTWCLQELHKIYQCIQVSRKRVLPVFYDVDPSEVRNQSGIYGEAFAKHEEIFQHDSDKIQGWRAALTQVTNLRVWDLRDKPQSPEIEKIVEEIINILNFHRKLSVPNDFVGMDDRIEELEKVLLLNSVDDVRAVGVCGMVGIGKTALATVLYSRISHQFDACCFIDDFSKIYEQDRPFGVFKQILHQTLGDEHQICSQHDAAKLIQRRLCRLSALIIFDNVEYAGQLATVQHFLLGAGSRIIIISRDEYTLKKYEVDVVYKVPLLNRHNSLQLFCRILSKHDHITNIPEELACDILNYANNLPLAIKELGSFLSTVDISEWKSAFARFIDSPSNDVMDVLQLSWEGLEMVEKEIVLHIACFFNGHEMDYVENILDCCGYYAEIGLRVISDKSLISISDERKIEMHGLYEMLGRNIIFKSQRKWSKLWLHEQFYNVVLEKKENMVEAIVLHESGREKGILMAEALSKMTHLRLLILNEVKFSGSLDCLSNKLRYVEWDEFPFLYLPSNFQPYQLVELILRHSSVKQLWKDKKNLPYLRTLDLSYSENLTKILCFGEFPNLEWLNLEGCVKLVQMDSSIGLLRKLVYLNLKNCENLTCIPYEIYGLPFKCLNLCGCSKEFNNPSAHEDFASCLLPFLPSFSCLSELDISFCSLSQIPDVFICVPWLERLNLRGNDFVTLPSLRKLSKLNYLNLEHCKQLKSLPDLPSPAAIEKDICKRGGMYIFNCPELGEREQCSNMTLSWMIQLIQAIQYPFSFYNQVDIVIPGSEIPRWFNNRRNGKSISIDPSPLVYDKNIIGIACCVVFSVEPFDQTTTRYEWGPVIRLGFKNNNAASSHYLVIPVTLYRYLIRVKSNHMWLIYIDRQLFFNFLSIIDKYNTLWDLDHIKMEASVTNGRGLRLEVKNCGFRWVFKQDQQPFESLNNDASRNEETLVLEPATLVVIEDEAQPQRKYNKSSD